MSKQSTTVLTNCIHIQSCISAAIST